MNFWTPSSASFGCVLVLLHFLYWYNGVYPRLYQRPLIERDGGCLWYLFAEKRSFGQFLYWLGVFFVLYYIFINYGGGGEYSDVSFAALTFYFIFEIFFVYKMAFSKEARDYNFCRTIKSLSIASSLAFGVFYAYSSVVDDFNTFIVLFFCLRSLLYDGFLYAFGGCSGDHQMAQSAITQNDLDEYASSGQYSVPEGARIFVPSEG